MSQEEYEGQESQDENTQDPTQNIKAEFQRKFENIQSANSQLQQSNQELNQKLDALMQHISNQSTPQKQQEAADSYEDIDPYDPQFYEKIKQDAVKEVTEQNKKQQQAQNERAQVLSSLMSNYPELNDDSSELTQLAVKKLGGMEQASQQSPQSYKVAVYEAATELGVLPKSKRQESDDSDEVDKMIGEGGYGMRSPKDKGVDKSKRKDDKLDPKTAAVAEAFGMDPNDKNVKKRLLERAQRKNWNKYQ